MSSCITNEELNRLLMITASATNKESVINRLSIKWVAINPMCHCVLIP